MTTTVKLLSTYVDPTGASFPPYSILDLPDAVATKLLAGGIGATTDLTGGTRRTREVAVVGLDQGNAGTMTAGSKATLQVPPGRVLVLSGAKGASGTATATDANGRTATQSLRDGAAVFGPYTAQASVDVLLSTGVLSIRAAPSAQRQVANTFYIVGDSISAQNFALGYITSWSRTSNVLTVVFNSTVALFPGCPVLFENVAEDMRGLRYATTGFAGGSGTTFSFDAPGPDFASVSPGGNAHVICLNSYASNGYFVNGNAKAQRRLELVGISAAVGRAVPEMLARLGDALASPAANVIVAGGINDVLGGADPDDTIANLQAIHALLLNAGKRVYACTLTPLRGAQRTQARADAIDLINTWLRETAATTPNMRLLDFNAQLVDPMAANKGSAKADVLAADDLHPAPNGAMLMGDELELKTRDIPTYDRRTKSNNDNYGANPKKKNILDSAPWGAGGAPNSGTGTVGASYAGIMEGASAAVFSVPARADGAGLKNQVVITPQADGDGARFHSPSIGAPRVFAGMKIRSEASIDLSGAVAGNVKMIRHYVILTLPGSIQGLVNAYADVLAPNSAKVRRDMSDWVFSTPTVALPTAPTGLYALTGVAAYAAGTATTFGASLAGIVVS